MVLTNYKYIKLLFLNTLRCNHLSIKTKTKIKKKKKFFLILGWLGYEVRAFIMKVLKFLVNTSNINCSIF